MLPIVRDAHAAQDVAQDAFVTCFTRLGSLRDGSRFGPWLLKTAGRQAIQASRRSQRMRIERSDVDDGGPASRSDDARLLNELRWPSSGESFVYTDIRIDTDLDERLFSLEPPAGYAMQHEGPTRPVDDMNGKMMGKTMSIVRNCFEYMNDHDGKWPTRLDDLRAAGMDAKKLQTLLSAPDAKDGKPAFLYRQPKTGETDVIVLYEAPEIRRKGFVVTGYNDGHAQLLTQKEFDEAMKKLEAAK